MKKYRLLSVAIATCFGIFSLPSLPLSAQEMNYQLPPKEIKEIALAKMPPTTLISGDNKWMLQLENIPFLTVEELAKPEYKLGGTRVTGIFGPSRREGYSSARLLEIETKKTYDIKGLPAGADILEAEWAPGSTRVALTLREADGLYLWMVNLADQRPVK